jgi:multidrug efflux system outer membrane protein
MNRSASPFRPAFPPCASRKISLLAGVALAFVLIGCAVGPNYKRPTVEAPPDWRWKVAEPKDHVPRGEWWTVFEDERLNALQQTARTNNYNLQAAFYRFEQARAGARISRSELFPTLDGTANWSRYRTSGNSANPIPFPVPSYTQDQWTTALDLSYEVDLWGRVRRSFESARMEALSLQAAYESVLLALQADVAATYLAIQGADQELLILNQTIEVRREALSAIELRFQAGFGTEFEVERTKVEVSSAEAGLQGVLRRRAELVNTLAVLCGLPPAEFEGQAAEGVARLPQIAPDLPSSLLERRPDVAQAEREMAARNARIGVATAAFFPVVRLTASGGYLSGDVSDLFKWDSRVWSIGPTVSLPLFAGGRNLAELERTKFAYEESVALYRQQILEAFREVEDSLAATTLLEKQVAALEEAARAGRRSAQVSYARFTAGAVNFLEVVDSETVRLRAELAAVQGSTEQRLAVVRLIKAVGGGWDEHL